MPKLEAVFTKKTKSGKFNVYQILDSKTGCVGSIYIPVDQTVDEINFTLVKPADEDYQAKLAKATER